MKTIKRKYIVLSVAILSFGIALLVIYILGSDTITAGEAWSRIQSGEAILVDIREEAELEGGMAEPAVWLATSEILDQSEIYQHFLSTLDKQKLVVVYCAAGVRAGFFVKSLIKNGYRAANMGGFRDWKKARLAVRLFIQK